MYLINFYKRFMNRLWSTNMIFLLKRDAGISDKTNFNSNVEIEFCDVCIENINDCKQLNDAEHTEQQFISLLQRGDHGLYGYVNVNECVYCQWFKIKDEICFDGCEIHKLKPNEAYIHFVFCKTNMRGKGFQRLGIAHFVKNNNQYTFYALVKPENIYSIRNFIQNDFYIKSKIIVENRFFFRFLYKDDSIA